MCLAIPARISKLLDGNMAVADLGGVSRTISLALVDNTAVGDYVIVHVGYALSRLDQEEAEKTLKLFAEMNEAGAREMEQKKAGAKA
ncbi:MAG: HypC/HybG/HupF family hydrogenase formation chaperone [Alphaproteobacteria bacterium]|nr:HypC/HybG/HupF family hydrogenase formation chaperone [Alphaproteobacteria bacterium]